MMGREELSYEYAGRTLYFCSAFCRDKFVKSSDTYVLEYLILPVFYRKREEWIRIMQHCIAINGSFFNTHRMVLSALQILQEGKGSFFDPTLIDIFAGIADSLYEETSGADDEFLEKKMDGLIDWYFSHALQKIT